jgi:hypothetical protein
LRLDAVEQELQRVMQALNVAEREGGPVDDLMRQLAELQTRKRGIAARHKPAAAEPTTTP